MSEKAARYMDLHLMADEGTAKHEKAAAADGPREETLRRFDEWRDPLRRYLMCSGASAADADDAVQETFLRLHRHLQKQGEPQNLCGWLFQVARNYLRDERKSARRHRTVALEREDSFADPQGSPERRTLDAERSRRLSAAIAKLPPHQRECVLLRASGLRYREIAQVLGIQIASVGAVVNRATARLREELS
jgi:RNA polymerase sigma-70 factor (ECF subfamily)